MKSRSIPKEIDVPFLNLPGLKDSVIELIDSFSPGMKVLMSVGLIPTNVPRVKGNPAAAVVSNLRKAFVRSIVIEVNDSFLFTELKVRVKKFESLDEALVL